MEKTDRQTDTKARGNYWSVTIYDPAEYAIFTAKDSFPNWVKNTMGQEEVAPTTGTHHWQCFLQTEQVRFSSVKKWLPTAHIELARNKDALANYCKKSETSVEGTAFNCKADKQYLALQDQLMMLARVYIEEEDTILKMIAELRPAEIDKKIYWHLANIILYGDPTMASIIANPILEKMWVNTRGTWVSLVREANEAGRA